ncbi:MAG: hypothetical protein ACREMA_06755 [Longimicrobiales bacterium]
MIYLMSREIGRDTNRIGFPSVQTCLAVVLQTDLELIGWHSFNSNLAVMRVDATTFATYVQANAVGNPVHLYTASNRAPRGAFWDPEVQSLATALNFHGSATMIDLKVMPAAAAPGEGGYVEFVRDHRRRCSVYFKRNAKMDYTTSEMPLASINHRMIARGNAQPVPLYGGDNGRAIIHTNAALNANSRAGRLNEVSAGQSKTITV